MLCVGGAPDTRPCGRALLWLEGVELKMNLLRRPKSGPGIS